jgi:hypothetical protein
MSNLNLGLIQVTSTVWLGEQLTDAEIQFLNSVSYVNEPTDSTVLLEVSYSLELYRRSKNSDVLVYMAVSVEGYNLVYVNDETVPRFFSLDHDDAYWHACSLIDGRN